MMQVTSQRQQHMLGECHRLARGDRKIVVDVLRDALTADLTEEAIYAEVSRRVHGAEMIVTLVAPDGTFVFAEPLPSGGAE